jgi:hypothetical protein
MLRGKHVVDVTLEFTMNSLWAWMNIVDGHDEVHAHTIGVPANG